MTRRHASTTPRGAALIALTLLLSAGASNALHGAPARADSQAGTVTITSGPSDPTTSTDATFTWTVVAARWAARECSLDDGPFVACSSPTTFTDLALGQHTFTVRTTRRNGEVHSDSASWTIVTASGLPTVDITDQP